MDPPKDGRSRLIKSLCVEKKLLIITLLKLVEVAWNIKDVNETWVYDRHCTKTGDEIISKCQG